MSISRDFYENDRHHWRNERRTISDIIFSELTLGKFTDESRKKYKDSNGTLEMAPHSVRFG